MGEETVTVMGLPKEGPVRIGVEVSIGDDITKMVYLMRKGDPETVMISTYAEMPITRSQSTEDNDSSFFVRAVAYDSAMNDVSMEDDTNLMVVGSDDDSKAAIMVSQVSDIEATDDMPSGVAQWWDSLDCMQMNDAVMPMDNEPAVGPDDATSPYCAMYEDLDEDAMPVVQRAAMDWYKVMINSDAKAGMYSVKATAGMGDDMVMSDMIDFTVLGGIERLALTGPERLGNSQVVSGFSVTATSEDDAVPGNVKGTMVAVTFSPADAASVIGGKGEGNNEIELDAMGMADFSILVTPSRLAGDNLIVIASVAGVTSNPLEVQHRAPVTGPTNRAPSAVGMVADIAMTLGDAPMTVTAGFADADGDTLGYSVMSSDTAVATAASNGGGSVNRHRGRRRHGDHHGHRLRRPGHGRAELHGHGVRSG